MSEKLEERICALERKIEEIIRAHNRHRHKFSVDGESGYPTYSVKKRRRT